MADGLHRQALNGFSISDKGKKRMMAFIQSVKKKLYLYLTRHYDVTFPMKKKTTRERQRKRNVHVTHLC
jgi:hypothetical protein